MTWRKNLRLSIRALWRCPGRTLLSAVGMAIGIAALVLLFGVGGGAERAFQAALESMGKNLLSVSAVVGESSALRGVARQAETLTLSDQRALAEQLTEVERVVPVSLGEYPMRYGDRRLRATVIGTTADFRLTHNQSLTAGRFFDSFDDVDLSRVAVVGARVARELFRGEHALGERLQVAGIPFVVIGILREKGLDPTGADEDLRILIPMQTAQRRLWNRDYVDRIFVQAVSRSALPAVEQQVTALLRRRHDVGATTPADEFTVQSQASLLKALRETRGELSRLLLGLAVLSLLMASTGLLAVSLLSVQERRGEIGLRLAVGALPGHVLSQFLVETVMVAMLGAGLGLLVGGAGIILGERLIGWPLAMTWQAVVYPFLVSLVLCLVFGAYPAVRAARLDPIVALRSH